MITSTSYPGNPRMPALTPIDLAHAAQVPGMAVVLDPHDEDDIVPVILEEPDHHGPSP
jgi:hypothetical protein